MKQTDLVHSLWLRRPSDALLALLVVACSVGSLAYHIAVAHQPAAVNAGTYLTLYERVSSELPAGGRIGFVSLVAEPTESAAAMYLAQHALAPRLLDSDFTVVSFVITTPAAPQALDNDPRLTGFEPIGTSVGGIRIYRRRQ